MQTLRHLQPNHQFFEKSVLWDWVGSRYENPGYINILQLKPEFDSITPTSLMQRQAAHDAGEQMRCSAFPKTETTVRDLFDTFNFWNEEGQRERIGRYIDHLGYKIKRYNGRITLELPDQQVLSARWNILLTTLKVTRPDLKLRPLKIFAVNGDIDDEVFLQAYFVNDFVLSPSVHDHTIHAIRTIRYMLIEPNYESNRQKDVEVIKKVYDRIVNARRLADAALQEGKTLPLEEFPKHLKKLIATISYFADNLSSMWESMDSLTECQLIGMFKRLESPADPRSRMKRDAQDYIYERFPPNEYPYKCLKILKAIKALEEQ